MSKIAIIGLGLVGNSMGMALRRALRDPEGNGSAQAQPSTRIVGFDPVREREVDALRKYESVDEIARSLQDAVGGAGIVVIATPMSAAQEVMFALESLVDPDATITDVLPARAQVTTWAREALGSHGGYVGGHPFSTKIDLDTASASDEPRADLFKNAPYCIMPLPGSRNSALSQVIALVEMLGAKPLFIDPHEHDSLLAAASHLPVLMAAALWQVAGRSPAWGDISQFASDAFSGTTESLLADPDAISDALIGNRQIILSWLDRYLIALQETRDLLASADRPTLTRELRGIHEEHAVWNEKATTPFEVSEARARAEAKNAIDASRPSRNVLGGYISNQLFGRRDKKDGGRK